MDISLHISQVAVYTLAALAAQDAPQTAVREAIPAGIAQSLRIDAPLMVVGLAAPSATSPATASIYATIAPPEVAATGLGEWAASTIESTGELTAKLAAPAAFADPLAIAPAPLPQPHLAIAPPEALDRAIAPLAAPDFSLWQPLSAPSMAIREAIPAGIAPPETLVEELIGLEASMPLFDPWVDPEELSLLDAEWSQLQHQDDLWNLLADLPADVPVGYWG